MIDTRKTTRSALALGLACTLGPAVVMVACTDDGAPRAGDAETTTRDEAGTATSPDAAPAVDVPDASDDGSWDAATPLVVCKTGVCAVELAAGAEHLCARMSDGTVRCWGLDSQYSQRFTGSLGRGGASIDGGPGPGLAFAPAPVVDLTGVIQISARGYTSCVTLEDGSVRCWGSNQNGELGLARDPAVFDDDGHPTPSIVALGGKARRVDVTGSAWRAPHACAVLESGDVECWGMNTDMALGRDAGEGKIVGPGKTGLSHVVRTAASIAMTEDGKLWSWGTPYLLGRPTSLASASPVAAPIATLPSVTGFDADDNACAVVDGELYCWGRNNGYSLGTGDSRWRTLPSFIPTMRAPGAHVQQIYTGRDGACIRLTDGALQCCGSNGLGELGLGVDGGIALKQASKFTAVTGLEGRKAVQVVRSYANGNATACALLEDGTVMCWGSNRSGQLGTGTSDAAPHPTPVIVPLH
ncbi:hypothetical protein AKJ09_02009 [Labilithrix luteola]|uniref:BNR repeat domain protein n=1 Tax=Labilithrix luteola TaxID=1391654 RepID=A0A0K1PP79_9BACT|nr:hypothetical protein [Labilithrix luteola]AKU95345.1 hypothetical protein AKJ09_02009 [Labilithrix luteola]